jgi:hypothetical protein
MSQQRLFVLAPEVFICQASFEPASGWRLSVGMRRQDELWSDAYRSVYSSMTSPELVDVICAEASGRLLNI